MISQFIGKLCSRNEKLGGNFCKSYPKIGNKINVDQIQLMRKQINKKKSYFLSILKFPFFTTGYFRKSIFQISSRQSATEALCSSLFIKFIKTNPVIYNKTNKLNRDPLEKM